MASRSSYSPGKAQPQFVLDINNAIVQEALKVLGITVDQLAVK
jgi:hypothetical protein